MNRMAGKTALTTGVLVALLALGAAVVSAADPGASRQSAKLIFGKKMPGVGTGLFLDIDYVNPDDPDAKPPAVRRVVETLAPGARVDTSVPDVCSASDPELMALGEAACPPGSKVGEGIVTVDSGLPSPARFFTVDVDFFNNTDQLIYLNTIRGTGARVVVRAQVSSNQIVTDLMMLPGTPPDGAAIDTVHVRFPRLVRDGRAYVTTPPTCPPRRRWANKVTFTYADGVEQTVNSRSPCRRATQRARR